MFDLVLVQFDLCLFRFNFFFVSIHFSRVDFLVGLQFNYKIMIDKKINKLPFEKSLFSLYLNINPNITINYKI